jgi:hypothetical protein
MPSKTNLLIRALLMFILLVILLLAYYWVHKPFDLPMVMRLGGALLDTATAAALFASAGGIGRAALARLDRSVITRAERLALETGIGLGLIGLGVLTLGLVGLFRPPLLWIILMILMILIRKALREWTLDARDLIRSMRVHSRGQAVCMIYCMVMLGLALLIAVAPPAHWDSLTYHLVGVRRYLQAGTISAQPDNFYLGLSQGVEMLFGLTYGLFGRDTAAAPVHLGLGVIGLLATAGATQRFAGKPAGRMAALLLLSAYNLWALLGWAYVDLGALMYGALALVAATAWRETRARGWLIVMGVIVGLAMGVKYTTLALGVALGLFVLIHEPRRVVQNGAIMVLAALVVFAPWAVKGVLLYHNPIYPFILNGLNWSHERSVAFSTSAYNLLERGQAWQIPILPVSATVFGQDNVDGFGFTVGPWLLTLFLFLPLVWAFLSERARRLSLDAVTILIPLLIFWGIMTLSGSVGIQTRLMAMAFPAFAAAGAMTLHGLAKFPKKPLDINFIVRAILGLTLALTMLDAVRETVKEKVVPYLLSQTDMNDYMYANTGAYYNAIINLPPGSRAMILYEPRGYYCPLSVTCTADVLFDNWKLPMMNEGLTPEQVFERYREQGYDYVLWFESLYQQYLEFSMRRDLDELLPAALEQAMEPVWSDELRYTLYGWKEGG